MSHNGSCRCMLGLIPLISLTAANQTTEYIRFQRVGLFIEEQLYLLHSFFLELKSMFCAADWQQAERCSKGCRVFFNKQ